jgi:membrane-bound ClpP family serine protease
MKEIIESIIGRIPSGMIFDTHAIIEYLLQNNSDEYLQNCNGKTTESYHGHIGQVISKIADEGLVSRIGESWSLNIHKTFSDCACWKKQ